MKLSSDTLTILKNFSTINEGIFVKPGNVIETISKLKNILARAELKDNFDTEFGIHDLNNFLSVLTLQRSDTPELDFDDKNILIQALAGRSRIKYRKAVKETILIPPDKKVNMTAAEINFVVTAEDFEWINRVASALSSPNIAFVSDGEKVSIETFDAKDDASHVNSTDINVASANGKKYRMVFATENLRLVPGAYDLTISSKGIGHFKNKTVPVEYWITTETGSKYEG
jgi:hypothetical protein